MTKQCEACKGAGYIDISEQECPDMVWELQEEIPEASINGGGLIVRNIIFITYHMTTLRSLRTLR
jgi:RecJ-like exonuclease